MSVLQFPCGARTSSAYPVDDEKVSVGQGICSIPDKARARARHQPSGTPCPYCREPLVVIPECAGRVVVQRPGVRQFEPLPSSHEAMCCWSCRQMFFQPRAES